MVGDERLEMVNDFVTESRDLLNDLEPQITQLERYALESGDINNEILNTIFRLFHSIKGMASFLDLNTVMTVTHEAETLLDLVRKGQLTLHAEHVDVLYRTSDFVRGLLDVIDRQLNDVGFEQTATTIIGEIHKSINETAEDNTKGETAALKQNEESHFVVNWEMVSEFIEEASLLLAESESYLLQLKQYKGGTDTLCSLCQNFRCFNEKSALFGYDDLERVSHLVEHILGYFRDSGYNPQEPVLHALLTVVEHLKRGISCLRAGGDGSLPQLQQLLGLLDMLLKVEEPHSRETAGKPASDSCCEQLVAAANCTSLLREPLKQAPHIVKVNVEKLDTLVNLVGELASLEGIAAQCSQNEQDFRQVLIKMGKVTRDIEHLALSMRMVPLGATFRKMLRLVRDLASKKHRKVSLEIFGEDTEVDKSIIEQLSDPLIHLIRNAVDHGLESPQERVEAGKSPVGCIVLEAKYSNGEVWVTVQDDGRGLNRDKILEKAQQKGLLKNASEPLADEAVWKLIFEPGLSTAEEITYISGRGVGMDVVKRNVERLGGRIVIKSIAGKGSQFTLCVPSNFVIGDGQVVRFLETQLG